MNEDVIVTCAVTGAGDSVGRSPHVPVTPPQIAAACIEAALASPVRAESREVTKGLAEYFDGRIFHVVYRLVSHELKAAAA